MAPLSIDNLKAPFVNRVHLITIIGVSVAFATFRLSGGNVGTAPKRAPAISKAVQAMTGDPEREAAKRELGSLLGGAEAPARHKAVAPPPDEVDEDESIVSSLVKKSEERTRPDAAPPSRSGGLDEIEKNLGLR